MNLLLFFLLPLALCSLPYQLVITTMFKNEARYLPEWIEYHRLIGVDHFYLYNNDSSDNYQAALEPYLQEGLVELIEWNSDSAPHHDPRGSAFWVGFQHSAFNDSLERAKECAHWMAIIDVDEFLFSPLGPIEGIEYLSSLLDSAPPDVGSFSLWWRNFGTSSIQALSPSERITESLVHRAQDSSIYNLHHKCIHRVDAISYTLVHSAFLKEGYKSVEIDAKNLRINHYYLGDRSRCVPKRCSAGELFTFEAHFNAVYDDSIRSFWHLLPNH